MLLADCDFLLRIMTASSFLTYYILDWLVHDTQVLKRQDTVQGAGRYGKAADMWSIGVILYVLLSGSMPFEDQSLYDDIEHARFSMTGRRWEGVSETAQDLIRKLLLADPAMRLTVEYALNHEWFADLPRDEQIPMLMGEQSSSTSSESNGAEEDDRAADAALMPPPQPRHQKRASEEDAMVEEDSDGVASTKRRKA